MNIINNIIRLRLPCTCRNKCFWYACDSFYKFTVVDVGGEGSNSDGAIFKNSGFGHRLINNNLNLPNPKPMPNLNEVLPHFFVADAAFPLHTHIMPE